MPTTSPSQYRRAYNIFLRTGRAAERKFNHRHDDLGRFASSDGAAGMSSQPNATSQQGRARARPAAKPAAKPLALDALSAPEESQGDPGAISSGRDDAGGVSYGIYQLSTNMGTAAKFVASPEASQWEARFQGSTPGTEAFSKQWREVAQADPAGFGAAQTAFIDRTNYGNAVRLLARSSSTDIGGASPTVKRVVYSTAVQHGATGGARIVAQAISDTDLSVKRSAPRWQATLIGNIYRRRIARVLANSSAALKRGNKGKAHKLHNVATIRLPREAARALSMLLSGE